tara:strand:+ start:75008 stop:75157 length:150 start_codon:yes stop_codon:yes gene_type:complete
MKFLTFTGVELHWSVVVATDLKMNSNPANLCGDPLYKKRKGISALLVTH